MVWTRRVIFTPFCDECQEFVLSSPSPPLPGLVSFLQPKLPDLIWHMIFQCGIFASFFFLSCQDYECMIFLQFRLPNHILTWSSTRSRTSTTVVTFLLSINSICGILSITSRSQETKACWQLKRIPVKYKITFKNKLLCYLYSCLTEKASKMTYINYNRRLNHTWISLCFKIFIKYKVTT